MQKSIFKKADEQVKLDYIPPIFEGVSSSEEEEDYHHHTGIIGEKEC
jgi:hypothetical protein